MWSAFKLFGHLGDLDNIELASTPVVVSHPYANYWFFCLGI